MSADRPAASRAEYQRLRRGSAPLRNRRRSAAESTRVALLRKAEALEWRDPAAALALADRAGAGADPALARAADLRAGSILLRLGRWRETLARARRAEESAVAAREDGGRAEAMILTGRACNLGGRHRRALALFSRAAELARRAARPDLLCDTYEGSGAARYFLGDPGAAKALFEEGLAAARTARLNVKIAFLLVARGNCEDVAGRRAAAIRDYREALLRFRREDRLLGAATVLINLAILHHAARRPAASLLAAREGAEAARALGERRLLATACHAAGDAALLGGDAGVALRWYKRGAAVAARAELPRSRFYALLGEARALRGLGRDPARSFAAAQAIVDALELAPLARELAAARAER